jgi:mono/diheme cytochrome c family protein
MWRSRGIALTCPMRTVWICWLVLAVLVMAAATALGFARHRSGTAETAIQLPASALAPAAMSTTRASPFDLAVGGELRGVPPGSVRFITRAQLLTFPQLTYTVSDDANFTGPTQLSGVSLEELSRRLSAWPGSDVVIAICDDQYRAHYRQAYLGVHHPLLVLNINRQAPSHWPTDAEGHGQSMGPFMISHPSFKPSPGPFGQVDEAQIPWGVVQLEFRNERDTFLSIAPRGPHAADALVQAGYRIAQQNCFRCHNLGELGGTKAGRPWFVLAAGAAASPQYFAAYVRDPQSKNPQAQMPGNPAYDERSIAALVAYFQTFSASKQEKSRRQEKP